MSQESKSRRPVAIVTGGASGIGRALGAEMARLGMEVVLADRQIDLAESEAAAIRASGGAACACELDVRDRVAFAALVAEVRDRNSGLDYLVNNAGIGVGGEIKDYEAADWDDVFDVNLRGVANGIHAAYPVMIAQRGGHIVNVASMAGLVASTMAGVYAATKHAVVGLTRTLRVEASAYGVKATAVCPGAIRTPILSGGRYGRMRVGADPERMAALWERIRPMDPDDFARRVVRRVLRNEAIVIEPRWWALFWYVDRVSPALWSKVVEWGHARIKGEIEQASGSRAP